MLTLVEAVRELLDNRGYDYLHPDDREMLKTALLAAENGTPPRPIRVKAVDGYGFAAYIYRSGDSWRCTLENGVPAAFSYAGIRKDETALRFALEDAVTAEEALTAVIASANRYLSGPKAGETVYTYSLV